MQKILILTADSIMSGIAKSFFTANKIAVDTVNPAAVTLPENYAEYGVAVVDTECLTEPIDENLSIPVISVGDKKIIGEKAHLSKPFSMADLFVQVTTVIKPSAAAPAEKAGIELNVEKRRLTVGEEEIPLTSKEFDILLCLVNNKGTTVTREMIIEAAWGDGFTGDARIVDSHVTRLRSKLGKWGADKLRTVYGKGYVLELK